jgi:N-acetylmuramoyl-L-alanine amidase
MHWISRLRKAARWLKFGRTSTPIQSGRFSCPAISLVAVALLFCFFATARAQQQTAPPSAPQPPSVQLPTPGQLPQPPIPPSAPSRPPELRFVVLLDPAHGGTDNGAILAASDLEKSYTLTLAIRLHVLLNARGIHSILTRDGDDTIDNTARAIAANQAHAAACILLHATPTGNGVHLFTSSLPAAGKQSSQDPHRSFLPWQTAQASYGTESLRLESDVNAALTNQHVPVLLNRTALMPLDSLACPAVAVEIAPLDANTPLTDDTYQQKIAQALVAALVAWRSDWRLQP